MSTREILLYYAGGSALFLLCIAVCWWSVNFFIRQFTQKSCQQFREHMLKEAERALKLFREGLCEQIAQQENKSDALARLYATVIDILRVGREFAGAVANGDPKQAEKMLRSLRSTGESLSDLYQKESINFPDEFCDTMKSFLSQQTSALQQLERSWSEMASDASQVGRAAEMKQSWLQFEERITRVMDIMRCEFRSRHQVGNVMMKWLNDPPATPRDPSGPAAW